MSWFKTILPACLCFYGACATAQTAGVFDGHSDVGTVLHAGSLSYNKAGGEYTLSGAGTNIWFDHDEFHFAWKKLKGDFILQCRAAFIGKGTELHRKLGWMIRASLDSSAAMVSATVHGDGLTSLQFRKKPKTAIEEQKSTVKAPDIIELERRGTKIIMSVARYGEAYIVDEVSDVALGDDVYVGFFICSHNKDVVEKAIFDNVRIIVPAKESFVPYRDYIGSHIETFDIAKASREIVYSSTASLQAPNWTKDGKTLVYNSNGLIYSLDLAGRTAQKINTGTVTKNNNDHVLSFDGKMLGLSSGTADGKYNSVVFTVPLKGGEPKQVTPIGPSYLHGFSPDGKYITYTGQRGDEFDIYKMPVAGGKEVRLTTSPGLDDGSEYSPDGKFIYFNSVRSGTMQLWRMDADGKNQTQLTFDEYNNWFPHVSPDGKWIAFLSFSKDIKPNDHPFYKHVYLRLMPVGGGAPKVMVYLYGGQGSINTPSWSPDNRKIAFVSNSDSIK